MPTDRRLLVLNSLRSVFVPFVVCLSIACNHLEPVPTSMPLATVPTPAPSAGLVALVPTYTAGPPDITPTILLELAAPTPAAQSTTSPAPLPTPAVYVIRAGDTLLAIAGRYGVSLDDLLKANLDVLELSNPDFVPANVVLTIPQTEAAAILETQATPVTAATPSDAGATAGDPLPEENGSPAATPGAQPAGPASGPPPTGALRPPNNPWIGAISDFDTGYCGEVVDGHGWSGTLSWPVSSRSIDDDRDFRPGHTGVDVNVELHTPVYAAAAGVVVWSGFTKWGGGIMVVLAHGNSWQSYYAHLGQVITECGATVASGDLLGFSGQSGMASWPHLHFEVRHGALSYDPAAWLP